MKDQIRKVENKIILNKSVPVTNNPKILMWLVDCQTNSHKNGKKNLSKNLLTELTDLFGPSNKSIRLEFMTKVWVLKHKYSVYNVFAAKGRGTSIEIVGLGYVDVWNGDKENDIIEFLEDLYELINKI
jgi:hypothetical protein